MDAAAPPPPPPKPRRGRACLLVAGLLVLASTSLCLLVAFGPAVAYRVRCENATLDGVLEVEVQGADAAGVEATRSAIRRRLRKRWIPAKVEPSGDRRLRLSFPAADRAEVRVALRGTALRFMRLVVPPDLTPLEVQTHLERLLEARARGTPADPAERYEIVVWHGGDQPALVERPGVGGAGAFQHVRRSVDEAGRPAIGFELTRDAGREFAALTRASVGRQLAIVLDGTIRSAPTIQEEIGRSGIINGGAQGWSEAELDQLIPLLDDALPFAVQEVKSN